MVVRGRPAGGAGPAGGGTPEPAGEVEAARRLATEVDARPKAPELLVRTGSQLAPLPLEALRVSVVLGATRARVLLDATFRVQQGSPEGTFAVALPDGASPVYLGTFQGTGGGGVTPESLLDRETDPWALLDGGAGLTSALQPTSKEAARSAWGELRPARVVEQAKAKVVYEATVRRRVDPALMEWSGSNKFTTRVFPLARGCKRIVFAYDLAARDQEGTTTVALPVPEKVPARVPARAGGRLTRLRGSSAGVLGQAASARG